MENELMNNDAMENAVVEVGAKAGFKKGAIVLGAVGAATGIIYLGYKLGKKLIAKVKSRKSRKAAKVTDIEDDDFDPIIFDENEEE